MVELKVHVGMLDGCTGVVRGWGTGRVVYRGWVPGGWYTGYYTGIQDPAVYIGIARAQPVLDTGIYSRWTSAGHSRPLQGPPHTQLLGYPPQGQIRRDSGYNILKLVNKPECHHKTVMRPVMLPVSKSRQ